MRVFQLTRLRVLKQFGIHLDDDCLNNNVENLKPGSQKENIILAVQTGCFDGVLKPCYAEKDGVRKEYKSTSDLVKDLTGTNNNGYFNAAVNRKNSTLYGWKIRLY